MEGKTRIGKTQDAVDKRAVSRRGEGGLTLLEVGMALVLGALVVAGMAWYASSAALKMQRRSDAQNLMVVARAGEADMIKNQPVWLASGAGALDPTLHPGAVVEQTVPNLIADGVLPASMQDVFRNGQKLVLLVQAIPNPAPTTGAPPYILKGLVTSYGGTPFPADQAGEIVNLAGAAAGSMGTSTAFNIHTIYGAGGAWQESDAEWSNATPAHRPVTGHVMALEGMGYGAAGSTNNGPWLARKVIDTGGAPYEHNTMQTDINMTEIDGTASHSLLGASSVQANEFVGQTAGGDINIGSITPTRNINIGGQPTKNLTISGGEGPISGGSQSLIDMEGGNVMDLNVVGYSITPPAINISASGGGGPPDDGPELNLSAEDAGTPSSKASINLTTGRGGFGGAVTVGEGDENGAINLNANGANGVVNVSGGAIMLKSGDGKEVKIGNAGNNWDMDFYSTNNYYYPKINSFLLQALNYQVDIPEQGFGWVPVITVNSPNMSTSDYPTNHVIMGIPNADRTGFSNTQPWTNLYVNGTVYDIYGNITASDRRLKKNIAPLTNALNEIDQLNGYMFRWRDTNQPDIGVIAQEVEKVFPQLVKSGPNGKLGVKYGNLVAPLIEAVKTLHHMLNDSIALFKQQIAALQQDDHTLQAQVQTLSEQNAALKTELAQQHLDLITLKYAIHQPLSAAERTLCGAACAH